MSTKLTNPTRAIAVYLPQFHPIPENNRWWGEGFTEWTNVTKAKPRFRGHYQPHLPADLGFYDLRLPETRLAQANMARDHGIEGFCYYHYWFNGRRLLERPFNEVLASGQPDFPFCLCWANESWTRAWDGSEHETLLAQEYGDDDDRAHMAWLANAFRDPRYIRINDKPLFIVYRAGRLPNALRTTQIWREEARKAGLGELFLCRVECGIEEQGDPTVLGFDAAIQFQYGPIAPFLSQGKRNYRRLLNQLGRANTPWEYGDLVETALTEFKRPFQRFPTVTPSWDNSPRRQRGAHILKNSSPQLYERWLRQAIEEVQTAPPDERIVFINAWNEWGEGNHLEPCLRWGRGYLEATRRALLGN